MSEPQELNDLIAALSDRVDRLAALVSEEGSSRTDRAPLQDINERLATLAARVSELRGSEATVADLEQQLARVTASRDAVAANLSRLQNRKAVRVALQVAGLLDRVRRWTRGRLGGTVKLRPAYRSQAEVAYRIRRLRTDRSPADGPLVSIITPTHNGADHLRRLLKSLRSATSYPRFEMVVVDNGSSDDTAALLRSYHNLGLHVVSNPGNETFSVACNQGAAAAHGEFLLFLNNDIEPVNRGWLSAMVESLTADPGLAATGAVLIYPEGRTTGASGQQPLTVQHRGVSFIWKDDGPRPVNLGTGEDPSDPVLTEHVEVPAATAACLLVRKSSFDAVGGFSDRYVYGWEDVDLCMKLRHDGGRVSVTGEAALFHYEFGTQDTLGAPTRAINYRNNSRVFLEQWAPQLRRLYLKDRISGTGFWSTSAGRHIAITVSDNDRSAGFGDWYTAHELGDALQREGWTVSYLQRKNDDWYTPSGADVVLMLLPHMDIRRLPAGTFTVAWVRNWVERWLDNPSFRDVDLVVASSAVFAGEIESATDHRVEVIPLATNPDRFRPVAPDIALRCDYTFTGSFWGTGRRLERYLDVRPDETFTIYGKGWDRRPRGQRYWRGHLGYERLPALYSSAKLVVDDTVEPNVPALNSRVFDALAAGCLVISDNPTGSDEWFDGLLPTYTNREGLRRQLDTYLSDDSARTALVHKLRSLVLARHTYRQRAVQFTSAIEDAVARPEVGIRIGPVTWENASKWGDTHFARDVGRELRALGWRTRLSVVSDWDGPREQASDVVVHLRGRTPYAVKPGNLNVLWLISHPADVELAEVKKYDLVFVASDTHATALREISERPVHTLLQATNPERYLPGDPDPELAARLIFVGNSRGEEREMVRWAVDAGLPIVVYGSGWDGLIPEHHIRGDYFPNERLPELYRSVDIVLSDHWPDMRSHGFVSNRVFDALAAGAFVISDRAVGIDDLLEGSVVVVDSQRDLVDAFVRYSADLTARRTMAEKGGALVRSNHTFAVRAAQLDTALRTALRDGAGIVGGGPSLSEPDHTGSGDDAD